MYYYHVLFQGKNLAASFRFHAPKGAMGFVVLCGAWYHLKYHPQVRVNFTPVLHLPIELGDISGC